MSGSALMSDRPSRRMLADVQAVVLDADGLVIDLSLWRRQLVRVLGHAGQPIDYEGFCAAWDEHFAGDVYCGRRGHAEAVAAFLRERGLGWPQIDEIEAACRSCPDELAASERPLPGVARALGRLAAAGCRLAVLCNAACDGNQLAGHLRRIGLTATFDAVLTSCDVEVALPEAAAFAGILARLQTTPTKTLFATRRAAFCSAAAAFGLRACAIGPATDAESALRVAHLSDLADDIERSQPARRGR